jgi:pilus assembly protein CpaF
LKESILERQLTGAGSRLIPYLCDPTVTDLLINGLTSFYVEKEGRLVQVPHPFTERAEIQDLIERLVVPLGKRVDASQPYLDGRLLDGSRFHIILPPLASSGPFISLRKHRASQHLEAFGSDELVRWLQGEVRARRSLLITGGTGTGKTTLLGALINEIPSTERVTILEETSEIRTSHPHALYLEARPASPDGKGEVTLRMLLRNVLRMRPDRVILGECRGEEAFDFLQAMNTGHPGSFGTIHANSALDGLRRLETLVLLTGYLLPPQVLREWIAAALKAVIYLERRGDQRRIREALSIHGLEGDRYRVTPRFREGVACTQGYGVTL